MIDHCTDVPLKVSTSTQMTGNVQTGVELTYVSFSFVQNDDAHGVMSLECSVSFYYSEDFLTHGIPTPLNAVVHIKVRAK